MDNLGDIEPIRIGICGTSGVGKTTLAMQLVEWLNPVYTIEHKKEVARIVLDNRKMNTDQLIDASQQTKNEVQLEILFKQLYNEIHSYSSIVSDRTIVDVLAYSKVYGLPEFTLLNMENIMQATIISYDVLFYCPVPSSYITVNDGVRSDRNIAEIDAYVKYYYDLIEHDELLKVDLGKERKLWFDKCKDVINILLNSNEYN